MGIDFGQNQSLVHCLFQMFIPYWARFTTCISLQFAFSQVKRQVFLQKTDVWLVMSFSSRRLRINTSALWHIVIARPHQKVRDCTCPMQSADYVMCVGNRTMCSLVYPHCNRSSHEDKVWQIIVKEHAHQCLLARMTNVNQIGHSLHPRGCTVWHRIHGLSKNLEQC